MSKFNVHPITFLAVVLASIVAGALGGAYAVSNAPGIEVETTVIPAVKTCQADTPKTEECAIGVDLKLLAKQLEK